MKAYLWIPLACLVGFVVGSWGARDELRAFKEHTSSNEAKAKADALDFWEHLRTGDVKSLFGAGTDNSLVQLFRYAGTDREPVTDLRVAEGDEAAVLARLAE